MTPNAKTNLQLTARENFSLYPDCYPAVDGLPTDEAYTALAELADGYGREDGFWEHMSPEECKEIVLLEFERWALEQFTFKTDNSE